ncbi:hypothetical protein [Mycobacterium intracellulare]|uniref:hypothetical protein n=1 Tax=Mycobacterium intracellulare TaxID=1767 RepID=UPI0013E07347|nr:hypothetical protein [Mycobacterium intracellulare]
MGTRAAIAANDVFLRLLIGASPRLAMRVMDRQFQKDAAAIREMAAAWRKRDTESQA